MIKKICLPLLLCLTTITLYSQCVLPTGSYKWGLTEVNNHVASNCGGTLAELIVPSGAVINITNNDTWDLSAYGEIIVTIQGTGSLVFNGSDQLTLASGSKIIIENTSNPDALVISGAGTNNRIVIGLTTYVGSEFAGIVSAGGADESGVLLPVDLVSFSSKVINDSQVQLSWITASEENNSHFELEHSLDGIRFELLSIVTGKGTTTQNSEYTFLHTNASNGINYYRIRQVDFNGSFEYSPTISQVVRVSKFFKLQYNTLEKLGFELSENADLYVYNLAGQLVDKMKISEGEHELSLSNFSSGHYIVKIYGSTEDAFIRVVR
jgi:hypothetical protein